jgi:hypothetical protein
MAILYRLNSFSPDPITDPEVLTPYVYNGKSHLRDSAVHIFANSADIYLKFSTHESNIILHQHVNLGPDRIRIPDVRADQEY